MNGVYYVESYNKILFLLLIHCYYYYTAFDFCLTNQVLQSYVTLGKSLQSGFLEILEKNCLQARRLSCHPSNSVKVLSGNNRTMKTSLLRVTLKPTSQLRFDYDTTMIRRYHDAFNYDGSDRNYDFRSIRLRYHYDTTTTKS